jgi:hypothetical protein
MLLDSIYKILAKILVHRFQPHFLRISRLNQTIFIERLNIIDNIYLTHDALAWAKENN